MPKNLGEGKKGVGEGVGGGGGEAVNELRFLLLPLISSHFIKFTHNYPLTGVMTLLVSSRNVEVCFWLSLIRL